MQTSSGHPAPISEQLALIGQSPAMERLRAQLRRIAPHFRTVLITGEQGTCAAGVAPLLHSLSPSANQPLTTLSEVMETCGSSSATLFLPALNTLGATAQSTVLLALRRGMRVIAATEHPPRTLVAAGKLRHDLIAALSSVEIALPALRTRPDDIPELARAIIGNRSISPEFLAGLKSHPWPGNLTELRQVLEQSMQHHPGGALENLPPTLLTPPPTPLKLTRLQDIIDQHVFAVLNACAGNKLRAAEALGISRSTLYRMLESSPLAKAS